MSKIAYAAAAALTLSLVAAGAHAQTADRPDPARLALARQIFEAQGGAKNAQAVMRSMEASMLASMPSPEAKQRMTEVMEKMATTVMPRLFDDMAGFYAIDFTEDQLKDVLAFYKSPTGQAMMAKSPVLAEQMGGEVAKLMPRLQLSVLDKVCSQTACTDQQQQQLAALKAQVPERDRF
jgi:hypothetical protein